MFDSVTIDEKTLRLGLEAAPNAIVIADEKGEIVAVNDLTESLFGYRREELIGKPVEVLIPERFRNKHKSFRHDYSAAPARRSMGVGLELYGRRKDGSEFPIEVGLKPLRTKNGLFISSAIADITKRKQFEAEQRQAHKMEAIGRLSGGIAHDFNNALGVIIGHASLALERLGPEEPVRRHIEVLKTAADHAASLTRQLLAFARKQVLKPKAVDLNEVIASMSPMLRLAVGEKIELVTVLKPSVGWVMIDRGQIEQVIMNLAANARDAMETSGGTLTIKTANATGRGRTEEISHRGIKPGSYVVMTVADSGVGIDAETQARIFEPFFTTKHNGTGLGLATVYGIARQSGGYITVHSEADKGTVFRVYLPRAEAPVEAVHHHEESIQCRGTILLVEDLGPLRELTRTVLDGLGYTVLEAKDGEQALRIAKRQQGPIHLLLTDVVMPGMNCQELAERLSAARPGIKVLYMSGYTDNILVHHGVLKPEIALLQKPFAPDELARKIDAILRAA